MGVGHTWVILHGNDAVLDSFQVSPEKLILLFNVDQSTLDEVYSVNGVRVERRIGLFDEDLTVSAS